MALNEDTEALLLAYVYGELSASDARDFERRMDAGTPEAAELRAEVEGLRASRELFGKDAAFGLRTGVDVPPAHLVDAIMNAEKLARPPAVRDAALARVAPPVDKSFTAKLSRWLLGGGVAVGAAAAFFLVVTRSAEEPAMQAEAMKGSPASAAVVVAESAKADEPPPPPSPAAAAPLGGVLADNLAADDAAETAGTGDAAAAARIANKLVGGGKGNAEGGEGGEASGDDRAHPGHAAEKPAEPLETPADFGAALEEQRAPDNDAPAQDPAPRLARGRADGNRNGDGDGDDAKKRAYKAIAQDEAKSGAKQEKLEEKNAKLDALSDAKMKAKESSRAAAQPAKDHGATKTRDAAPRAEPSSGDAFGFDGAESKKAEQKRESEKAGMRSSVGADKDLRATGIATGAAASSGSGPSVAGPSVAAPRTMTTSPSPVTTAPPATMTPPADAPSRALPPPPAKPRAVGEAKPQPQPKPTSEADDEESAPVMSASPKPLSREELDARRNDLRKKSAASSGKSFAAEAERARRLEQANIALASAQREMGAKRWLSALDQMALAESLDPDRALGATPLVGQMRALVELKRPVDAARVARRLGRWDVKAFDVVPGLLLGAKVAEQVGDERLARELWTRLLEVPSEKAKAQAALARMEGAKALRRQQYDSDAADAPAAAAESAKE